MKEATLLLNASYEPLRLITFKRAVVLVLQDKAEIVELGDGEYRSAKTAVQIPSVIRLKRFVKVPYRAKVPLNFKAVMNRDKWECQYCGKRAESIDHVIP